MKQPQIATIPTKQFIDAILSTGTLDLNGKYLNADAMIILQNKSDLDELSDFTGCYFIFSTLPIEKVPIFSNGGRTCYENPIVKDGEKFGCLYNGKGKTAQQRLVHHLFNPGTLDKVKDGRALSLFSTGAMSLTSVSREQLDELARNNLYIPTKHRLKSVKSVKKESINKFEGYSHFLNGIDITESEWRNFRFGVIPIKTDHEFGRILIEQAFCEKYGRPPLCRRHG